MGIVQGSEDKKMDKKGKAIVFSGQNAYKN
jgi:hypothetical protein